MENKPKNFNEFLSEEIEPWSKSSNYTPGAKEIIDQPAVDPVLIQDVINRMTNVEFGTEYKNALREFNLGYNPTNVRNYPKDYKGDLPFFYNQPIETESKKFFQ